VFLGDEPDEPANTMVFFGVGGSVAALGLVNVSVCFGAARSSPEPPEPPQATMVWRCAPISPEPEEAQLGGNETPPGDVWGVGFELEGEEAQPGAVGLGGSINDGFG
jgi:hypothetical protein